MRRLTFFTVLLLVASACSRSESAPTTTTLPPPPSSTTTTTTTQPRTTAPPTTTTTTVAPVAAPVFEERASLQLGAGDLWSIPVLFGPDLWVSTEAAASVLLVPLARDLSEASGSFPVADGGVAVADHKHIVQSSTNYISYSLRSADGLFLTATPYGEGAKTVEVSDVAPTNDMVMFGDGERIYVGKFLPGVGHEVFVFDADLTEVDRFEVGGGPDTHANGAAAIVVDGVVHLVAPDTLEPGANERYRLLRFGLDGSSAGPTIDILRKPGLSIVSGLVHDPVSGAFLLFYGEDPNGDGTGGDIRMASYDAEWGLLDDVLLVAGSNHRPHAVLDGDDLYLGYDTSDLTAHVVWLERVG